MRAGCAVKDPVEGSDVLAAEVLLEDGVLVLSHGERAPRVNCFKFQEEGVLVNVSREGDHDLMNKRNGATVCVHSRFDASNGLGKGVDEHGEQEVFVDQNKPRNRQVLHSEIDFHCDGTLALEDPSDIDQLMAEIDLHSTFALKEAE
jgi:hypothetical protein